MNELQAHITNVRQAIEAERFIADMNGFTGVVTRLDEILDNPLFTYRTVRHPLTWVRDANDDFQFSDGTLIDRKAYRPFSDIPRPDDITWETNDDNQENDDLVDGDPSE